MDGRDLTTRVFALALLAASAPAHAADREGAPRVEPWMPDREIIETLERATKMPEGAAAIDNAVRYYTGWRGAVSGHRLVYGTIISRDLPLFGSNKPAPSVRIVEPNAMPDVLARNCGIVMLEFNVDTGERIARCSQP